MRILKASYVELKQLHSEAELAGYMSLCDSLEPFLNDRCERIKNGRFYAKPGDSGTPPHTN